MVNNSKNINFYQQKKEAVPRLVPLDDISDFLTKICFGEILGPKSSVLPFSKKNGIF